MGTSKAYLCENGRLNETTHAPLWEGVCSVKAGIVIPCGVDDYSTVAGFGSLSPRKDVARVWAPQLSMSGKCSLCDRTCQSCKALLLSYSPSLTGRDCISMLSFGNWISEQFLAGTAVPFPSLLDLRFRSCLAAAVPPRPTPGWPAQLSVSISQMFACLMSCLEGHFWVLFFKW